MKTGRRKGSITVFAVLLLPVLTGFLLIMAEGVRMQALHNSAQLRSYAAIESVFANYEEGLWENYHILACPKADFESLYLEHAESGYHSLETGMNLLLIKPETPTLHSYTLLTDGGGVAYLNAISSYMKNNVVYESAKTIYNSYQSVKELLDSNESKGSEVTEALESLEKIKEEKAGEESSKDVEKKTKSSVNLSKESTEEGGLQTIERLRKTQILELVVEDTKELSEKEQDLSELVSHRSLSEGKNIQLKERDWLDRILLQQYLLNYLTDYTNPESDRGMAYELEYLLAGKGSDIENLRSVVNELLLIREAANMMYLMSDIEKMEEASALAWALAGISANPVLVEAVKIGLVCGWAFAESVLDIRALLAGRKIPLIKSKESWTMSLGNIGKLGDGYPMAKDSKWGISYTDYLGVLLLFKEDTLLANRAMDVQEEALGQQGYSIKMDEMIIYGKLSCTYSAASGFMNLKDQGFWNYKIRKEVEYGYP